MCQEELLAQCVKVGIDTKLWAKLYNLWTEMQMSGRECKNDMMKELEDHVANPGLLLHHLSGINVGSGVRKQPLWLIRRSSSEYLACRVLLHGLRFTSTLYLNKAQQKQRRADKTDNTEDTLQRAGKGARCCEWQASKS